MLDPISGRNGLMIYGNEEIPIYSFILSGSRNRQEYRTSASENFPRRTKGVFTETLVIRGVQNRPSFIGTAQNNPISLDIGWNDFVSLNRRLIVFIGLMTEFRVDFNYFFQSNPAYIWTATFQGVVNTKTMLVGNITPHNDVITCPDKICDNRIATSDNNLHSGSVFHVKRASLISSIIRPSYMTSSSANHIISLSTGMRDNIVEMDVQGDFDYWLDKLSVTDVRNTYGFYYGTGLSDYWLLEKMKVLEISNFTVNVQTGEMVQFTVRLGSAYG